MYFFFNVYFERERERMNEYEQGRGREERVRESQADSTLSAESNVGFELTTSRS